jgi:DNA polymerase IV
MRPLNLSKFPRAILHIDGDCFFVSCEVAKNPALKGKVVITGVERGIVSSLSYEAKAKGIKRAMSLREVKKICPDAIFIPSDYETYSLYSLRMFNIVRRFTSEVEEYSIDECFADLTGLQRPLKMSYEQIARKIKEEVDKDLGFTFSIGLAPSKVLAKLASKWKKPSGLTPIAARDIHTFLIKTPVESIWGIGPQTTAYLKKLGIKTAYDFASKEKDWVKNKLTKPHYEIWQELRGNLVYELDINKKNKYRSISKTKTFTPPSSNPKYVYAQLSKNIENACIKARRHNLTCNKIFFYLKTKNFKYHGTELKLTQPTNIAIDLLREIEKYYPKIFDKQKNYRATGIVLMNLTTSKTMQMDLFSDQVKTERMTKLFGGIDKITKKYGKHTLYLGSSHMAINTRQHKTEREKQANRKTDLFKGETSRKRLGIPMLGKVS